MSVVLDVDTVSSFRDMELPPAIQEALEKAGYELPTPIQAATIPSLLAGRDVLGQAQTGTGKTAAFALPLLSRIDCENPRTQVLVLTPTRELAIQVADSFKRYSKFQKGLRVAPIYGGQAYSTQINQLERGLHVVVGTPGRVIDHMKQGMLKVDGLQCLVLDEADEMLRMGFVDDVQWILSQTPAERQIALFSATMPPPIRKIANEHLKDPHVVAIDAQQRTAETIRQRFIVVPHRFKYDALTRILEQEERDGVLIFVKTKVATVELAENLAAKGYAAIALNGDIAQSQRERTVEQLKSGAVDIVVATDVAARGLDVSRISHVINYDLPFDSEAYVHRIGRTGRAGRSGEAILFVAPRERGFLRVIDRSCGQGIEEMSIPTAKTINAIRIQRFKAKIEAALKQDHLGFYQNLMKEFQTESQEDPMRIAAALASIAQGKQSFLVEDLPENFDRDSRSTRFDSKDRKRRNDGPEDFELDRSRRGFSRGTRSGMERFRIEVGASHGVKPGNIVGAIANEAGLDSKRIGEIAIFDEFSTVDLPSGMPRDVFRVLGRAWIVGRQLRISKLSDHSGERHSGEKTLDDRPPRPVKTKGPEASGSEKSARAKSDGASGSNPVAKKKKPKAAKPVACPP